MKVVIAEPIKKELSELIKKNERDWVVYEDFPKDKQEFMQRVKDADIACSYFSKFDAEVLSSSSKLKFLAIAAVGAEASVDMDYASESGVTVMNCPGYNSLAVAEIAIGLAIDVARSISFMNSRIHEGVWANGEQPLKQQISGRKVALIGYGDIGKAIHKLLKSWCQDFMIINSKSSEHDIDSAVSDSNLIFVCCALNAETEGIVSGERLKMMKDSTILVNVSRGLTVDEDALYSALRDRTIAGAGLDVFRDEPTAGAVIPANIERFTKLSNVVCLPHIAGGTNQSGLVLSQMLYENIQSCIDGSPINIYK